MYNCPRRSVPEMQWHVAGKISNQQAKTTLLFTVRMSSKQDTGWLVHDSVSKYALRSQDAGHHTPLYLSRVSRHNNS